MVYNLLYTNHFKEAVCHRKGAHSFFYHTDSQRIVHHPSGHCTADEIEDFCSDFLLAAFIVCKGEF